MIEDAVIVNVNDDEANRYTVTRMLQHAGFEVREAANGQEALREAKRRPAVMILDVNLPDMSGFEVCRRIKSQPTTASVAVIHLSASYLAVADKVQGLEGGADAYLTQPVEPAELVATVRAMLRVRSAESSAREASLRWRSTFDAIQDAVLLLDGDGIISRCNRSATELIGKSFEHMIGRSCSEVLGERFGPVAIPGIARVRETNQREVREMELAGRWYRVTVDPVRDEVGSVMGAVKIFTDVSDRRQLDEERRRLLIRERTARQDAEAAQRKTAFIYQVTSSLLTYELDSKKTLAQLAQAVVPTLGDWCAVYFEEDGVLTRVAASGPAGGDAPPLVLEAMRNGQPRRLTDRDSDLLIVPLLARGRALGAVVFSYTRADRQHTDEDVALAQNLCDRAAVLVDNARLYQQAQHAIRGRDETLAVVSHDLKNPLAAILTSAALLNRTAPKDATGDKARRQADLIQRSVLRMDRLIRDLLDLARIEAGRLTVESSACELEPLVNEVVEMLAAQAAAKPLNLVREVTLPPDTRVWCDRERVVQVLSNLMGNAIKFTPENGTVVVHARRSEHEVEITVEDTGPGIPAEQLPHVFDRYWQAKETAAKGTGLGLFIAKGIVEAHGGHIHASARRGGGACFTFTLPLYTDQKAE